MDVDENRVLVGAFQGAFLYERPSILTDPWPQVQFLDPILFGDSFGSPVALRGDVALFGDGDAFTVTQQAGGVDIFRRSSPTGSYTVTQTIWPADTEIFDSFGSSVELGDGFAFAGAGNDNHNGKQSTGTVTQYNELDNGSGHFAEVKKLAPADLGPGDGFGGAMDLDGDRLVVGASRAGAVYVFERDLGGTENWGEFAKLKDGTRFFGSEVSVSGNTIIASSFGDPGITGSVSVYEYDVVNQSWEFTAQLILPNNNQGDLFGNSAQIRGDLAVVGQLNLVSFGTGDPGEAFVFRRDEGGPDNWGLVARLSSPDPQAATNFGTSVEIMNNLVLVGSQGVGQNPLGSVYVFVIPEPSALSLYAIGILSLLNLSLMRSSRS